MPRAEAGAVPAPRRSWWRVFFLATGDDADVPELLRRTLLEAKYPVDLHFVPGFQELFREFPRDGKGKEGLRQPRLTLVDLRIARDESKSALAHFQADPELSRFPLVALDGCTQCHRLIGLVELPA